MIGGSMKILQDFWSGKMNVRKLILWAFLLFFLVLLASAGVAVVRAIWSVSDFTVENPQVWIEKGQSG